MLNLLYLVPLRPRATARNWDQVIGLLRQTVASALADRGEDIRLLIISQEDPRAELPADERIDFLRCDPQTCFDGNSPASAERAIYVRREHDKWTKLKAGLVYCRVLQPRFVMYLDADDLVSNRLPDLCRRFPDANGWFADTGWEWITGWRWVRRVPRRFYGLCGSSSILNLQRIGLPESVDDPPESHVLLRSGHSVLCKNLQEAGIPLAPVPFPAVVYRRFHGENHSGIDRRHTGWGGIPAVYGTRRFVRMLPQFRPLTTALRREFGIESTGTRAVNLKTVI